VKNSNKNIAKQSVEPITIPQSLFTNPQSPITIHLQKKLHGAEGEMLLDVQMEIQAGEIVALYGASGAGKTSTLRMLAGLMQPDSGYIQIRAVSEYDSTR